MKRLIYFGISYLSILINSILLILVGLNVVESKSGIHSFLGGLLYVISMVLCFYILPMAMDSQEFSLSNEDKNELIKYINFGSTVVLILNIVAFWIIFKF